MKKHMDPKTGETGRCSAKSPETCPVVKDLPAEEQAAFHFDSSHETLLRGALEQRVQARNGWSNVESVRREKPEIEASPEVSAKELLARGASGKSVRDALRAENPEWSHAQVHAVYSSMVKKGAVLDEAKNPKDVGPSNSKPGLATRPVPPESTPPPATGKKPVPKPAPTELNLVSERMQEEYVRTYNNQKKALAEVQQTLVNWRQQHPVRGESEEEHVTRKRLERNIGIHKEMLAEYQIQLEDAGLGHKIPDEGNVLRVRNRAQQILFMKELRGQISDGMWENTVPFNHWAAWSNTKVVVDPKNLGRNFSVAKDNYQLNAKALLSVVGDRMVGEVQKGGNPDYTEKDMAADLKELRQIFKTSRSSLEA